MSLSDYNTMETTKETKSLDPFLTAYEKMPLDTFDTEDVELETTSPTELYYSVFLSTEEDSSPETYFDISLTSEIEEEPSSKSFLKIIKEEITDFLKIQKIQAEDSLPFIEIRKEAIYEEREK